MSVAIIGMGCLFPKAFGLKAFWRLLCRGEDGISDVPDTHWSVKDYFNETPKYPDHTYCKKGGFLTPVSYDPSEFGIPPNIMEATDTAQLLGLLIAKRALEDAGYGPDTDFPRDKTSVILGVTGTQELVIPLGARLGHPIWRKALEDAGVPSDQASDVMERISNSYVSWQESSFPGLLGNVVAGRIANRLDLGGTNCVVDAACASSISAINLAVLELLSGKCDMTVTGGVDTLNDIFMHMCFSQTGVLSFSSDIKPFSEDADGTVLGEGIGLLVLKRLEDAEKDGDRIYAVIQSVGSSSDGRSQSIYAPNVEGQVRALQAAYREAGVDPSTVGLIEAHGTGTRVGDAVEFSALKEVFNNPDKQTKTCAIGSVKSNIGHTKAAAGAAGMIKAALALYHKTLPPTLKVEKPDPKLEIDNSGFYLNTRTTPWFSTKEHPRRSGVSSFGFGGSNFHVVLEEYKKDKTVISWTGAVEILAFSAQTKDELAEQVSDLQNAIAPVSAFHEIASKAYETRSRFSSKQNYRLLVVLERPDSAVLSGSEHPKHLLDAIFDTLKKDDMPQFNNGNVYYGGPETSGKLAFMFPGQGSQYCNMGIDLACCLPEADALFRRTKDKFEAAAGDGAPCFTDLLFPRPGSDKDVSESQLRSTDVAQPAIGCASLLMLKFLNRFGIRPDAVCGHSFGELTALYAAGRIDEDAFLSLAVKRGRYMADAGKKEKGAMTAVKAPLDKLDRLIADNKLDVVLANRNSPDQGVLSGSETAIAEATAICNKNRFRCVALPVAAAFHSKLVEDAAEPFNQTLSEITIKESAIPVFSNTTGEPYPENPEAALGILQNHILNPVDFINEIEQLYESGVRLFLEVGPKSVLTGLVKKILKGREFRVTSIDQSSGKQSGMADFARALCFTAANGHDVDLTNWEDKPEPIRKQKMSIPLSGANYRLPYQIKPPVQPSAKRPETPPTQPTTETDLKRTPDRKQSFPATPPAQTSEPSPVEMPGRPSADALLTVTESLKSLQALQTQTAEAHQKFLETQTEASRSLQKMLDRTRRMAEPSASSGYPFQPPTNNVSTHEIKQADPATFELPSSRSLDPDSIQPLAAAESTTGDMPAPAVEPTTTLPSDAVQNTISETILNVVSELTGYPAEMIELDMDIESDLGIDSIKRVEILSVFESKMPDLPPVSADVMGSLKTLNQIVDYLTGLIADDTPEKGGVPQPDLPAAASPSAGIENTLLDVVSGLTGYPAEMIELDMDIESDLGIDSIKRVEILSVFESKMPDLPPVSADVMGSLKTLNQIVDYLTGLIADDTPEKGGVPQPDLPAAASPSAGIENTLLDVVSGLTGYPAEMIELDMDIESDLGIDSIKRVEILSAFESKMPDLPPVSADVMGSLKTLQQVIDYIKRLITGEPESPAAQPPSSSLDVSYRFPSKKEDVKEDPLQPIDRRVVSIVETAAPNGKTVHIPAGRSVYITDDKTGLGRKIADILSEEHIQTELVLPEHISDISDDPHKRPPAGGLIIVPDVDLLMDRFGRKNIWNSKDERFIKQAFTATSRLANDLCDSALEGGALFATITRLDGCFGFKGHGILHPLHGALAGISKTAAIEWENVCCHAIDISPDWKENDRIAPAAVNEILNRGPVEIGLDGASRYTFELVESTAPEGRIDLGEQDVVVITGGARGVTSACAYSLAKLVKPVIVLLGRSPLPVTEPDWLAGLHEESDMKRAILKNSFKGTKPTPAQLENMFKQFAAAREISGNMDRLIGSGATIVYRQVDVRDPASVESTLDIIRKQYGEVRAIIHGAGILEDRLIKDKTPDQFEKVFDTKAKGLNILLHATRKDKLKYIVLFSSVSARMGNTGQADYAAANEVLNKIAQQEACLRKGCRVVSINWGPWDGGMVSPALKHEFKKQNVGLIPIKTGAMSMVYEMMGDRNDDVEVVLGATMIKDANKQTTEGIFKKKQISTDDFPVLASHQLNGKPVVPFALMLEWFARSAVEYKPELVFHGVDGMRLLSGLKLDDDNIPVNIISGEAVKSDHTIGIPLELRNGIPEKSGLVHSKATTLLAHNHASPPVFQVPHDIINEKSRLDVEDAYKKILFHGKMLHGIKAITGSSPRGMIAQLLAAPKPEKWLRNPEAKAWLTDPLVIDAAFQMAILWCYENVGLVSLPVYIDGYRQYRHTFPEQVTTAVMEVRNVTDHTMKGDFTFLDSTGGVVATITGYESVMDKSLIDAFKH